MSDDKEGEDLARAWLAGKNELIDDLAALVDGMDRPLDATARAFLQTIGSAAKAAPKSKVRQTPAGAPAAPPPDLAQAQPSSEASPSPQIDLGEFLRRQRERERAARIEQLWRENAAFPVVMDFTRGTSRW